MSEAIKRCPFCAEEILVDAKKCKHCGSLVEVDSPVPAAAKPLPLADYGVALLAAPVVATMLIWLWVGNMNLLQSPGRTMTLILAATGIDIKSSMDVDGQKRAFRTVQGVFKAGLGFKSADRVWPKLVKGRAQ